MADEKSAIIFGGSRGIGRAVAERFVGEGFQVSIAARTGERVAEAVQRLSAGWRAEGVVADISDPEAVRATVTRHLRIFGGLDVAVAASGVQGPIGLAWENDPADWQQTLMTNLLGSYNVSHEVMPVFLQRKGGVVIFFSGGGAAYARPRFSAYGCCKTGVLRLTETIHEELVQAASNDEGAGGIRIYAVAPGAVKTRMTEQILACKETAGATARREAEQVMATGGTQPEKAAELCLYLATVRPRCLSGRLVHVHEPYRDYVARFEGKDIGAGGMLRRQPYPAVK